MKKLSFFIFSFLLLLSFGAESQLKEKAKSAEEARLMENCCALKNKMVEAHQGMSLTPYQAIDFKKKRILLYATSNSDRSLKQEWSFQQRQGKWFGITYTREGDWEKYLFY